MFSKLSNFYGVNIVVGEFGAGKTFYTFLEALKLKRKYKDNILIIANAPYSFVDIIYSSYSDIETLFKFLVFYIKETNNKSRLLTTFKPIYLIVDEAHLYFPSSGFGVARKFGYDELLLLTQVRKRNIKITFITQELGQLNKRIRVLAPFVRKYYKGFYFYRRYKDFYLFTLDSTDLLDPTVAKVVGGGFLFGGSLGPWRHGKKFKGDRWVTNFVVGDSSYIGDKEMYMLKKYLNF